MNFIKRLLCRSQLSRQLYHAAHDGMLEEAKRLLDDGANVNATPLPNGYTALHCAILGDHVDIVKLLISHGANVNAMTHDFSIEGRQVKPFSPLYLAMRKNRSAIAQILIGAGCDVNAVFENGDSPLHVASRQENDDVFMALIAKGAEINKVDNKGATPLHYTVCFQTRMKATRLLIERGADVNAVDDGGDTPLFNAARHWVSDAVNLLLLNGSNVNAVNKKGETPLLSMLVYLAPPGAGLDKRDWLASVMEVKGADPIRIKNMVLFDLWSLPEANELTATARALIAGGANVNVVDQKGKTPLTYAREYCAYSTIVPLLTEKNGR